MEYFRIAFGLKKPIEYIHYDLMLFCFSVREIRYRHFLDFRCTVNGEIVRVGVKNDKYPNYSL